MEKLTAELVQTHLNAPTATSTLVPMASAAELLDMQTRFSNKLKTGSYLALVHRVDIQQGVIAVALDQDAVAKLLNCKPDSVAPTALAITSRFQMRRRGVELKLHLGKAAPHIDRTLVQNIVKAQRWLSMILGGKSLADIAEQDQTTSNRIRLVTDLAVLAPDILEAIASGTQPDGLNTDKLIKTNISPIWSEQRDAFIKA